MQLVAMIRDPAVWPSPHRADVAPSMIGDYAKNGGWQVAPGQPVPQDHPAAPAPGGRIAIVCGGPSLKRMWPPARRKFDGVVAVNEAAYVTPCDWWCCLDGDGWTVYGTPAPVPRVGYCGCVWMFGGASPPFQTAGLSLTRLDAPPGCQSLSMLAAIAFAFETLKAESVEIYGADLSGSEGCRGQSTEGRTPERWAAEKEGLSILMARYPGRITRILPKGNA